MKKRLIMDNKFNDPFVNTIMFDIILELQKKMNCSLISVKKFVTSKIPNSTSNLYTEF